MISDNQLIVPCDFDEVREKFCYFFRKCCGEETSEPIVLFGKRTWGKTSKKKKSINETVENNLQNSVERQLILMHDDDCDKKLREALFVRFSRNFQSAFTDLGLKKVLTSRCGTPCKVLVLMKRM